MNESTKRDNKRWSPGVIAGAALCHLLGVSVVFTVLLALSAPLGATLEALSFSLSVDGLETAAGWHLVVQGVLAVVFWTLIFGAFRAGTDTFFGGDESPRVVTKARGTVITETLIVLPVLLLLIFGLFQLSLNNIAGVFWNVAEFEATRAAWVWEPEPDVSEDEVQDRVRIAAATTMTPVASGAYPGRFDDDLSDRAEQTQQVMAERFLTGTGIDPILNMWFGGPEDRDRLSIEGGLDGQMTMAQRAEQKFEHAYQSTEVRGINAGGTVEVDMTYHHFQAMPLVGEIFGEGDEDTNLHYQRREPDYSLPAQINEVGRLD